MRLNSLALAAAVALVPSLTAAAMIETISVLTNNVFFLPKSLTILNDWGQATRARLINRDGYMEGNDVVVLEECFDNEACSILKEGLRKEYKFQTPTLGYSEDHWTSTTGNIREWPAINGGVAILSKWPILEKHQFIYKDDTSCGWDSLANKGFVYVVLDYKGTNIHVFGTHMQSDDNTCGRGQAALCRAKQLEAWRSFIDSRNIPPNELVIMAGDFNIKKDTDEFNALLKGLDANQPNTYAGHDYTWDTRDNSIASIEGKGSPPEYLDYVLTDKRHSAGLRKATQTTLRLKSSIRYILRRYFKREAYDDYSDHYPVRALIEVDLQPMVMNC